MTGMAERWEKMVEQCPDGYVPDAVCKLCGNRLQGQGEGRPAESYLGTFTGLCYPCNDRPACVARLFPDGAKLWTHPASCPSHRRDRERIVAYDDCEACKGKGFTTSYGSFGASYRSHCNACSARFEAHPKRARMRRVTSEKYRWQNAQSARFAKLERRPPPDWDPAKERARLLARYARFEASEARWRAWFMARHTEIINGIPWEEDAANAI